MTLIEKVQSLITASNSTTGASDTDLTDAVQRLISGYGGGGGDTPVFYVPSAASGVSSIYGSIIKLGHKVTWVGQVYFTSTTSGDKHIFTLPAELRPYTKYLFKCGSDSSATDDTGYILPNGEVHIVLASSKSFSAGDMSWDIITPGYTVSVDSAKVSSSSGGIEKIDDLAIMQVSITVSGISAGWQANIITVPSGVRPLSEQCPFCIYRTRNTAPYLNTWIGADGKCDMYINPSYGNIIDIMGLWQT